MSDPKFKVGDIVRVTPEGQRLGVSGAWCDRLEVTHVAASGAFHGGPCWTIKCLPADGSAGITTGAWREQWYELVDDGGPW